MGLDDGYMRHLEGHFVSPSDYQSMSDGQRAAANISDPNLHWTGLSVNAAGLALVNLRFNPWLQAYAIAVVGIGLSALFIWAPPVTMSKPIADFEFFLRNSLNVPRFAMLLFLGMVLVIVAMRARAILARRSP